MTLYIGPLRMGVTDEEVTAFLGITAVVQRDKTTGRSRGFALADGDESVIQSRNGNLLNGIAVIVKELG